MRTVRQARGWSIVVAAAATRGALCSSALSAYERAERPITFHRLQLLALLYGVTVDDLLPRHGTTERTPPSLTLSVTAMRAGKAGRPARQWCDLLLAADDRTEAEVFTVSPCDRFALAALVGVEPGELQHRLDELGVLA